MKTLLVAMLFLVSSSSFASGLVCRGQGYSVQLYNHVHPELGTKNPAVLLVSTAQVGTVAKVEGNEIQKITTDSTLVYTGVTHDESTGRYSSVSLMVVKEAASTGAFAGQHFGRLTIKADHGMFQANVACSTYLKTQE